MELNTCSRNYKAIPNKKTIEWTENVSSRWLYSYRLHLWLFSLGENKGHTWLIKWDWTKVKIVEREKNVINNRPKSRGRLAQSMKHLFCKIFASSRLRLWQPTPGFISREKSLNFANMCDFESSKNVAPTQPTEAEILLSNTTSSEWKG